MANFNIFLTLYLFIPTFAQQPLPKRKVNPVLRNKLSEAVVFHRKGEHEKANAIYDSVLAVDPLEPDGNHLKGLLLHNQDRYEEAARYIMIAIQIESRGQFLNSLGETYRNLGRFELAIKNFRDSVRKLRNDPEVYNNLGLALWDSGDLESARESFHDALKYKPDMLYATMNIGKTYFQQNRHNDSLTWFRRGMQIEPSTFEPVWQYALALQHIGRLDEAFDMYLQAEKKLDTTEKKGKYISHLQVNMGAIRQEQGRFKEAILSYQAVLRYQPDDVGAWNNLGACWSLSGNTDPELALQAYGNAISILPSGKSALMNAGIYYQEQGHIQVAQDLFSRVIKADPKNHASLLQAALLISPIMDSARHVVAQRERLKSELTKILKRARKNEIVLKNPLRELEQTGKFYLVYHGHNDLEIQRHISCILRYASRLLHYIAPNLLPPLSLHPKKKKIRVGFISKFFTHNHAHGQLLEGVMKGLPRDDFHVVAFHITNPAETSSYSVKAAVDTFHSVPLTIQDARAFVLKEDVDALIWADTMSEPLNYYLAFGRLAPVQIAFWGNPITTGVEHSMDYFISSEWMESPDASGESKYSEQVVLIGGQGIWYNKIKPPPPPLPPRSQFGLDNDWVVFSCLQSNFKLHPDFDFVLSEVLRRVPNSHVILIEGRKKQWTERVKRRIRAAVDGYEDGGVSEDDASLVPSFDDLLMQREERGKIYQLREKRGIEQQIERASNATHPGLFDERVHFLPRVNGSDPFLQLIGSSDVVLHPFPFGGSKTAADALVMGVPVVTMAGRFLRARMAQSFYRTIEMPHMITHSISEYIELAVKLGNDEEFRAKQSEIILQRVDRIFEDHTYVEEWERFLRRAVGSATRRSEIKLSNQPYSSRKFKDNENYEILNLTRNTRKNNGKNVLSEEERGNKLLIRRNAPDDWPENVLTVGDAKEYSLFLNKNGRVAESASLTRLALQVIPNSAPMHSNLGAFLQQQWRLEEARSEFALALTLQPNHPGRLTWLNNIAVTLHGMKKYHEALHYYQLSLREQTGNLSQQGHLLYNYFNLIRIQMDALTSHESKIQLAQTVTNYLGIGELPLSAQQAVIMLSLFDWKDLSMNSNEFAVLAELQKRIVGFDKVNDPSALFKYVKILSNDGMKEAMNVLSIIFHENLQLMRGATQLMRLTIEMLFNKEETSFSQIRQPICNDGDSHNLNCLETHLIVQYFHTKNDVERQKEIDEVLNRNIRNNYITKIHILTEEDSNINLSTFRNLSLKYRKRDVIVDFPIKGRLTFAEAALYAEKNLRGHAVLLSNADVAWGNSIVNIGKIPKQARCGSALTLARWDIVKEKEKENVSFIPRIDLQDSWVLFPPLPKAFMKMTLPPYGSENSEGIGPLAHGHIGRCELCFPLGVLRADNRIAQLFSQGGLKPVNLAFEVMPLQLQQSLDRTYKERDSVRGAGRYVPFGDLRSFKSIECNK
eukprot:g754.t1